MKEYTPKAFAELRRKRAEERERVAEAQQKAIEEGLVDENGLLNDKGVIKQFGYLPKELADSFSDFNEDHLTNAIGNILDRRYSDTIDEQGYTIAVVLNSPAIDGEKRYIDSNGKEYPGIDETPKNSGNFIRLTSKDGTRVVTARFAVIVHFERNSDGDIVFADEVSDPAIKPPAAYTDPKTGLTAYKIEPTKENGWAAS